MRLDAAAAPIRIPLAEELIRGVNEAVRVTLKHGTEARPTPTVHNLDKEGTALPSLARGNRNAGDLSPVVNLPLPLPLPRRAPTASFHALQEWEGYVVEMRATDFVAHLTDLTAGASHEQEEAIIPLTELSDHDAARMTTGSVFRWVIGYERSPAGNEEAGVPDRASRPSRDDRSRSAGRRGMGARDDAGVRSVTKAGTPPGRARARAHPSRSRLWREHRPARR